MPEHLRAMRNALETRPVAEKPSLEDIVAGSARLVQRDGTGDADAAATHAQSRRAQSPYQTNPPAPMVGAGQQTNRTAVWPIPTVSPPPEIASGLFRHKRPTLVRFARTHHIVSRHTSHACAHLIAAVWVMTRQPILKQCPRIMRQAQHDPTGRFGPMIATRL